MINQGYINPNRILLFTTFVLLCFSWTNFFYITPLIIPLAIFLAYPNLSTKISKVQLVTLLFFLYCVFSLSLISYSSLFDFDFYRRDGNIFISLIPLITITFFKFNFDIQKYISRIIYLLTVVNVFVYYNFVFNGNLFEISDFYYFGFTSHNASGGFLAILTSLSFVNFIYKKNYFNFFIFAFNFYTIFESGSRGSYLAFLAGIVLFFLYSKKFYKTFSCFLLLILSVQIFIFSWGYDQHHRYWNQNDFYATETLELDFRNANNISHRIIKVWPWAIDDFLSSPILGTGFSSFNDRETDTQEVLPFIKLRFIEKNIYNSGHAHHSFLHIIAELGLIGFMLIVSLIYYLFKSISNLNTFERDILFLPLLVLILMSLTEHRLAAPSQAFIFFVFYSLVIRNKSLKKDNEDLNKPYAETSI